MVLLVETITNWPQAIDNIVSNILGAIVVIALMYMIFR